jgi:phosphoribosylpyrophosphate synthetase
MYNFTIPADNDFLKQPIQAYFHTYYVRMGNPGNPDYINHLKNTFADFSKVKLDNATNELIAVLKEDLPLVLQLSKLNSITVCVVPRAKAENLYQASQLLFKTTVKEVISQLIGFIDGTDNIRRYKTTFTTHLRNTRVHNEGPEPYSGITKDTCIISQDVKNKDILLIDDLYTKSVYIDEDAIQALIDNGARSVVLYSIGAKLS